MMRSGSRYAVAVRKPDGEIIVDTKEYPGILGDAAVKKIPFIRGVINFIDSLVLGMRTLLYSASFYEDEEEASTSGTQADNSRGSGNERRESVVMGLTLAVSIAAAVVIFMLIPYFITSLFEKRIDSHAVLAMSEGMLRLLIFFAYILLISRMKDIQRVFMYHGAEHKCINCIEQGMELNVENVRKSARLHKRCGTSFLFLVVCISIIFFLFIRTDSGIMRIAVRLLLVPAIAGCAYEFIRLAGRSENALVSLLSRPGMVLQKLTTREPDDSMIEVAIASVEAVFDWRAYLKENEKAAVQAEL